jgi:hypothetical protein
MMSRGYARFMYCGYDRAVQLGVHSEGKGGERVVAIPSFQGGSPSPVSIKDRVILTPMASFDLY